MSKLTNYLDTITELGMQQGLSASNDVILRVNPDVLIILSFEEPIDHLFPLNGLWMLADSTNANYKKLYRRTSKTPTAPYQNTWQEVVEYDDMMNTVQTWDAADLPQPVIVSGKGGQLQAPLLPHAAPYVNAEVIPKSYVDGVRTAMNNSFFTMFNNMNARVNQNLADIRIHAENIDQINVRIDALMVSQNSVVAKVFQQETEDTIWTLRHEVGIGSGYVVVLGPEGDYVWPDSVNPMAEDPTNVLEVTFSAPVSGLAFLMYVPLVSDQI